MPCESRLGNPDLVNLCYECSSQTILYVVNGQIVKHKDLWSVADLAAPFSLVAALYMLARQVIGAAVGLIAWVLSMSSPATPP